MPVGFWLVERNSSAQECCKFFFHFFLENAISFFVRVVLNKCKKRDSSRLHFYDVSNKRLIQNINVCS